MRLRAAWGCVMAKDVLEQVFAAFDGDDMREKNTALGLAYAEIERLREEIAYLRRPTEVPPPKLSKEEAERILGWCNDVLASIKKKRGGL